MVKRWILQVAHACNKALTLTFNESGQKDCLPKERGALRGAGVMMPRRLEILWRVRSCCIHKDNRFHIAKPSWHRHAVTRGKLRLGVPLG